MSILSILGLNRQHVRFVNPIEAGPGDGEGYVVSRQHDTLVVSTAQGRISVPVNLVYDGNIGLSPEEDYTLMSNIPPQVGESALTEVTKKEYFQDTFRLSYTYSTPDNPRNKEHKTFYYWSMQRKRRPWATEWKNYLKGEPTLDLDYVRIDYDEWSMWTSAGAYFSSEKQAKRNLALVKSFIPTTYYFKGPYCLSARLVFPPKLDFYRLETYPRMNQNIQVKYFVHHRRPMIPALITGYYNLLGGVFSFDNYQKAIDKLNELNTAKAKLPRVIS